MTKPWSYELSPCLSHGECTVPATIMIVRECTGPYAISHPWKKQRFQGFLDSIGTEVETVRDRTKARSSKIGTVRKPYETANNR
jgi:hypothetical protein